MKRFEQRHALVTGASSGIGQAIALALAAEGAIVHAVARQWTDAPSAWHTHAADLALEADVLRLAAEFKRDNVPLDMLIHSAGAFAMGDVADFSVTEMDHLYHVNVRAPFLLTQQLLSHVVQAEGQIVFINSSAGLASKQALSGYSSTKFAIKSIADSLRDEVNSLGVRVMSVYPGKTASAMQKTAHQLANKPYYPETLMQPVDVAHMVLSALALPITAEMTDVHIRPMKK